jgi:formylglycine-generating enzyme required for sulfatase activity
MQSLFSRHALPFVLALVAGPATVSALTIETVPVGNPGNPADKTVDNAPIAGAVADEYTIGKFEVTNSEYAEFLNAVDPSGVNHRGLYNAQMTSDALGGIDFSAAAANGTKYSVKAGRAANPVVFVSFFDAARFTNWLHNGQGAANTENGSYQLLGGTAIPSNADFVSRKITASWSLPTYDEWYKAAYHKNDGVTGNYFDYPTSSDTPPTASAPPGGSNSANFSSIVGGLTNAGAYLNATSPYGAFDQAGNVWEWTNDIQLLESRRVGGGAWFNGTSSLVNTSTAATLAANETNSVGFRVVRVTPGALPGDYNSDGEVNAADYTVWRDTLGSFEDLRANGDDTGPSEQYIDEADYLVWKNNFGSNGGAGATSAVPVPEPSTLLLFAAPLFVAAQNLRLRLSAPANP